MEMGEYMKLGVTMVFALVIAFFAAHSFTSLFEQEYKLTFRRSVIVNEYICHVLLVNAHECVFNRMRSWAFLFN